MTPIFPTIILVSLTLTAALGLAVTANNPTRASNRGFALASCFLALWLTCMFIAATADTPTNIEFWIRQTILASMTIPFAFDALRLSLISERFGKAELWSVARLWLPAWLPFVFICQTEFFLVSVTPLPSHLHTPVYGPGFALGGAYMLLSLAVLTWRFNRAARCAVGTQRIEIHFVLLGCIASLGTGSLIWIAWSVLNVPEIGCLLPLSVVVMQGTVACGIATQRILGVTRILRRVTANALMALYLAAVYFGVFLLARMVASGFRSDSDTIPHVLAAAAVVLSVSPSAGYVQKVASRLFVTDKSMIPDRVMDDISVILRCVTTVDDLLARVAAFLQAASGSDRVMILIREADRFVQRSPAVGRESDRMVLSEADPMVSALRPDSGPLVLDSIRRRRPDPTLTTLKRRMQDANAAAAIGIHSRTGLRGIVLLEARLSGRSYDEVEQHVLQAVCNQLVVAIENAGLYTELQKAKAYDEILLDSLTSGVIVADMSRGITVFNRESQRITGMDASDTLGRGIECLPTDLAEPLRTALINGHAVKDEETTVPSRKSGDIPLRLSSSLFFSRNNEPLGAMLVMNDITAERRLEAQVRRTEHLSSLGTLSAGMAHEIKNPLVTIKAFTQLLPERYGDDEFRRTFFDLVGEEVERIDSIVGRLLSFSRPSASSMRRTGMHEVLDHALTLTRQPIHKKNIHVLRRMAAADDRIRGDSDALVQVFVNFLLNAVQATDEGGEICVTTVYVGEREWVSSRRAMLGRPGIRVLVRDSGCGIAPEHLPNIFDPFFTTKSDGTGLGLAVAHRILTEHGATVEMRSAPGSGTTVDVVFPLISEDTPA